MCTCGPNSCAVNTRSTEASYLTANPPAGQTVSNNFGYAQQSAGYAVQAPLPYSYSPTAAMPASVAPSAMMAANRVPFVYAQQFAAQQVVNHAQVERHTQGPMYISSPTGTHVNVSQGAIKTEVRGIFVSNVDYKASSKDLQRYFGRAGEIVKCQLQKDPVTGKSKGNATVQYAVAKDAKRAVAMFHSEKYMGMRLKVRLDKEPVAVGTPSAGSSRTNGNASNSRTVQQSRNNAEPIIVNGSSCQS